MNTTASPLLAHGDLYDPDDVLPRNSPLLQPLRPQLRSPTPSPPPISSPEVSSPPGSRGGKRSNRRMKSKPSRADAILIGYLDNHRQNDIAALASIEGLASETESHEDTDLIDDSESLDSAVSPGGRGSSGGEKEKDGPSGATATKRTSGDSSSQNEMVVIDLKSLESLAAGALAACTKPVDTVSLAPSASHDVVAVQVSPAQAHAFDPIRPADSFRDRRSASTFPTGLSSHSTPSIHSPSAVVAIPSPQYLDHPSPITNATSTALSDGLAPIQLSPSPRYDANAPTLPSIRSQLGDIQQLANNHVAEERRRAQTFSLSPPATTTLPSFPSLSNGSDPPTSPLDIRRGPFSPGHPISPSYHHPSSGFYSSHSRQPDYNSSSTATPGSNHSTPGQLMNGLSINDITNPGIYVCKFDGCTAQPFATQYLLNSHANVHSSARPHYCPVKGCSRAEGGKGFKRKNEMIRHGLVHDSPGYVCPFCPDREHKYPRPDNLQRHVRVHHMDKDKDDPQLREVLSQRSDGPNRGRRRRGGGP